MLSNTTLIMYEAEVEIECPKLKICGFFVTILLIVSLVSNTLVSWIVFSTKELKRPIYFILACVCLVNLLASATELPILIVNLFNCG